MREYTEQQKEIKTIRGRGITLQLSAADVTRISEKAASVDLTVSELLEGFIGDLIDGTYSGGSDERELAAKWFDRRNFRIGGKETFIKYLIEIESLQKIITGISVIDACRSALQNAPEAERQSLQDEITSHAEDIKAFYKDYESCTTAAQPFDEAIQEIRSYKTRLDDISR